MPAAALDNLYTLVRFTNPRFDSAAIVELYEANGGIEAFTKHSLSAEMKDRRGAFLRNQTLPRELYTELVHSMEHFTSRDLRDAAESHHIVADYAMFKHFWTMDPNLTMQALDRVNEFYRNQQAKLDGLAFFQDMPDIHAGDCKGDPSGDYLAHAFCQTHRKLFLPANYRILTLRARERMMSELAPEIKALVTQEALQLSESGRSAYASTFIVDDAHWSELAKAPEVGVIHSLVTNTLLPPTVALQLAFEKKTQFVRVQLAKYTTDPELLQIIWHSTTSRVIREAAEKNMFFVK